MKDCIMFRAVLQHEKHSKRFDYVDSEQDEACTNSWKDRPNYLSVKQNLVYAACSKLQKTKAPAFPKKGACASVCRRDADGASAQGKVPLTKP